MISRICPSCGELLFSAFTGSPWTCPECGQEVPERVCKLRGNFLCEPEGCDRAQECRGEKYGKAVE